MALGSCTLGIYGNYDDDGSAPIGQFGAGASLYANLLASDLLKSMHLCMTICMQEGCDTMVASDSSASDGMPEALQSWLWGTPS